MGQGTRQRRAHSEGYGTAWLKSGPSGSGGSAHAATATVTQPAQKRAAAPNIYQPHRPATSDARSQCLSKRRGKGLHKAHECCVLTAAHLQQAHEVVHHVDLAEARRVRVPDVLLLLLQHTRLLLRLRHLLCACWVCGATRTFATRTCRSCLSHLPAVPTSENPGHRCVTQWCYVALPCTPSNQ